MGAERASAARGGPRLRASPARPRPAALCTPAGRSLRLPGAGPCPPGHGPGTAAARPPGRSPRNVFCLKLKCDRRRGRGSPSSFPLSISSLTAPRPQQIQVPPAGRRVVLKFMCFGMPKQQFSWECRSGGTGDTYTAALSLPIASISAPRVWVRDAPVIAVGVPFCKGRKVGNSNTWPYSDDMRHQS